MYTCVLARPRWVGRSNVRSASRSAMSTDPLLCEANVAQLQERTRELGEEARRFFLIAMPGGFRVRLSWQPCMLTSYRVRLSPPSYR